MRAASRHALLLVVATSLAACTSARPAPARPVARTLAPGAPSSAPSPSRPWAVYRGDTAAPTTLARFLAESRDTDVIAFGETHDDLAVAEAALATFRGMLAQGRPVALAMEFFERDQQDEVDAWLAGRLDEESFRKATKRSKSYATTHGPLMALARERGAAVIAANAPRRLVTAWRKSDLVYDAWRSALPEADRALVPRSWSAPKDAYWTRFQSLMGERAVPFYRAQTLWDDAMAESVADYRAAHPESRVLLVVGGFHVAGRLGTVAKLGERRPQDRIRLIVAAAAGSPVPAGEAGREDLILRVAPKPEPAS